MVLTRAASARAEVVLEVGVAAPDLLHALEGRLREWRAPEIRVDDHAGRVEDARESRRPGRGQLLANALLEVAGVGPRLDLFTRARENTDRKSTRLNSSHLVISYAVFCLQK